MGRWCWFSLGLLICAGCAAHPATVEVPATQPAAPADEIVAAPPVIPAATFKLTDFGGVGDGDALHAEIFFAVEDGGQHGFPEQQKLDAEREKFLKSRELRRCGSGIGNCDVMPKACAPPFLPSCRNERRSPCRNIRAQ